MRRVDLGGCGFFRRSGLDRGPTNHNHLTQPNISQTSISPNRHTLPPTRPQHHFICRRHHGCIFTAICNYTVHKGQSQAPVTASRQTNRERKSAREGEMQSRRRVQASNAAKREEEELAKSREARVRQQKIQRQWPPPVVSHMRICHSLVWGKGHVLQCFASP